MNSVMQNFQNNLGFSLYAMLYICYMFITLEDRIKSKEDVTIEY